MATKKISELDTVPSVDGTETFPILKSGYNYKMTVSQVVAWISLATTSVAGLLSSSDKSKLDSVQTGATANATNAELRNRATHTGTQPAATITGLATVATSNDYGDLDNLPSLATVATSGSYNDLTDTPVVDANYQHLPLAASQSATGTTAGTAATISKAVFQVTTADASNTGIIIPSAMTFGTTFTLVNSTTTGLNLYPPTGGQINYAGVNVPLSVSIYNTVRVILIDATNGIYQQL